MGRREPCQILRQKCYLAEPLEDAPNSRALSGGLPPNSGEPSNARSGQPTDSSPISIRQIGLRPAQAGQTFDGGKRRRLDEGTQTPGPRHPDEVGLEQRAQL